MLSVESLSEVFEKFFENMKTLDAKEPEWGQVFDKLETSDGGVSIDKFIESAKILLKKFNDQNVGESFDYLDLNGNGNVSLEEIKKSLQLGGVGESGAHGVQTTEQFWIEVCKKVDINKDGQIDKKEWETHIIQMIDEQFVKESLVENFAKKFVDLTLKETTKLSDKTRVGNYSWGILKTYAMLPGYTKENWIVSRRIFISLNEFISIQTEFSEEEKELIAKLVQAQMDQGDMRPLEVAGDQKERGPVYDPDTPS